MENYKYNLINDNELKKELNLDDNNVNQNTLLQEKADELVDRLLNEKISEHEKRLSVDKMGNKTQIEAANLSKMLRQPVMNLAKNSTEGAEMANLLLNLKNEVESLDPNKFNFSSPRGFLASLSKYIPFIRNSLTKYFDKFETSEVIIARIVESLQKGGDQLSRDNVTLSQDKERMQAVMGKLQQTISLGKLLDQKLEYKLEREIEVHSEKHNFVKNELLFPLRQRIIDLQQTLVVNQQGILTTELIIRNNRELIRGVDRSTKVTVSAMQVAVACALALNNQEIVLKKVNAINDVTSKLIVDNAARLKTQGVEIHKKASEATLNIEDLEKAFRDIKSALNDISKYRNDALPRLKNQIEKMNALTNAAEKEVTIVEKRESTGNAIIIDID